MWRTVRQTILAYTFILPSLAILVLMIVVPVFGALVSSARTDDGTWSLIAYRQVFQTPGFGRDVGYTLVITIISCCIVLVTSILLAVYLRLNPGWLSTFIQRVYYLPIFIPGIIATYAIKTLYEQHGWVNTIGEHLGIHAYPKIVFTGASVILAQIWFHVPFTTLLIGSALQGVPDGMVESARDVGARRLTIVWRILLPQVRNICLFAVTLVFLGCFGGYTVPYLLGPNNPQMLGVVVSATMATYMEPHQASAISVLMFAICAIVAAFYVQNMTKQKKSEFASSSDEEVSRKRRRGRVDRGLYRAKETLQP
ncbi:ABC transporter permease [Alicyclobacillus dauci]|uniref:ABC transporter permease subunit n=1 Tax=Alicyclobacillus dauci TaxID=1475485 RepID=A0ABY6Z1Y7_9BACL|nr:ABC transporter permease subunit [Alicyclobacillus dauci]WAH36314.1 ABC transporter permease subunit [Alicyclobacillus dauci]